MIKRLIALLVLLTLTSGLGVSLNAQVVPARKAPANTPTTSPLDLARSAVAAQGGEKFRNMKSMVQTGALDFYGPYSKEPVKGDFIISVATEGHSRIEVNAPPLIAFKQISNGERFYTSIPIFQFPDPSTHGLRMLAKYDQPGYTVTALPNKEKLRAFRIKAPNGGITDFFIEATTGRVQRYTVSVDGNVYDFELKNVKETDGLLLPVDFKVRIEIRQGVFSLDFKVKETKVDQLLAADLFTIPQ
jgi:hypothetical protein